MKNCVLCHKFHQVLVDLTFLDLGKEDSHSQGGLTCALLLVVSRDHRVILIPQGRPLKEANPPGGCFLVLRGQTSRLEGTL